MFKYYTHAISERENCSALPACLLYLFALFICFPAFSAESPRVLVSIKPLHSLVAGVMEGVGEPQLLLTGQQGPHDMSFKPSQMQALHKAELIFTLGPALEVFLEKPLASLPPGVTVIRLQDAPGITLYPYRELHTHAHDDEHEEEAHGSIDPHLWLNPQNAAAMVNAIAKALAQKDPAHAARYRANADALRARLESLDSALRQRFTHAGETKGGMPYLTYHPAYQYFERRYGLPPAQALTMHPELGVSAAALEQLEKQLAGRSLACIISEAGYHETIARRLAQETGAQIHLLSPEGMAYNAGKELYFEMMNDIATIFSECLKHAKH